MLVINDATPDQNSFENTIDIIVEAWFDLYCTWLANTQSVELLKEQLKTSLQQL